MTETLEVRRSIANPDLIPEETVCPLNVVETKVLEYDGEKHIRVLARVKHGPYAGYKISHTVKVFQTDQETSKKYIGGMLAEMLEATGLIDTQFTTVDELAEQLVGKDLTAEIRQTDKKKSKNGVVRNRLTQHKIFPYVSPKEADEVNLKRAALVGSEEDTEREINDIPF